MNRTGNGANRPDQGVPRASGDEPAFDEVRKDLDSCSPRQRG